MTWALARPKVLALAGILLLLPASGLTQTPVSAADSATNADQPEAHGTQLHWRDIPRNVLKDQVAIWTSPAHITRRNAKWWVLFGGTTAAMIATDRPFMTALPNNQTQAAASRWASRLAADYSIYPLTATFYFAGKLGDNPRARDTGRIGIEAMIDAEIAVNILKYATQRPRPDKDNMRGRFWHGGDSFPSGHSIKSWALAAVVAEEFPRPKIVPVIAYGLASTVVVARVGGRRHFPFRWLLRRGNGLVHRTLRLPASPSH